MKSRENNSSVEGCPIRNVVSRFGDKWSLLVIVLINENGVLRFNELGRLIPDISSRVLSGTLRVLEADGLISRKVYPVVPPKVEYRLTEMGVSLMPIIEQLTAWAKDNMARITEHRRQFGAVGRYGLSNEPDM